MSYCFLGPYVFMHQGSCAKGWKHPNTNQETLLDCRNECAERGSSFGYFAYSTRNVCACFFANDKCTVDNRYNDHNAYRIVREGIL